VTTATLDPAEAAYDALAPAYDVLTADYDYDVWLSAIERVAIAHGLAGRRVLDVACGTGKSFLPLLERGYEVTACDISQAMLPVARAKVGPRAQLCRLDMRALPALGPFDLITCLDDALNYLPDEPALAQAGLTLRARLGQLPGALLDDDFSEFDHAKALYVSAHPRGVPHDRSAVVFECSANRFTEQTLAMRALAHGSSNAPSHPRVGCHPPAVPHRDTPDPRPRCPRRRRRSGGDHPRLAPLGPPLALRCRRGLGAHDRAPRGLIASHRPRETLTDEIEACSCEDTHARRIDAVDLRSALRCIDMRDRQLLLARYWQELPHAETARRLGLTEATVRVRLHRLHNQLRTLLREPA
jgi:RNA polymerase sigma factor (sigma-70 family)